MVRHVGQNFFRRRNGKLDGVGRDDEFANRRRAHFFAVGRHEKVTPEPGAGRERFGMVVKRKFQVLDAGRARKRFVAGEFEDVAGGAVFVLPDHRRRIEGDGLPSTGASGGWVAGCSTTPTGTGLWASDSIVRSSMKNC